MDRRVVPFWMPFRCLACLSFTVLEVGHPERNARLRIAMTNAGSVLPRHPADPTLATRASREPAAQGPSVGADSQEEGESVVELATDRAKFCHGHALLCPRWPVWSSEAVRGPMGPKENPVSHHSEVITRRSLTMDHVSLTVRCVDQSIKFYRAVGLKVLRTSALARSSGGEYKNAYMYSGRFMLELLPLIGPRARSRKRPHSVTAALHGSVGITHLGVRVLNLDTAIRRLEAVGARMIGRPFSIDRHSVNVSYFDEKADRAIHYVRKPRKAWRIALFSDPDGVTVELVER